MRTERKRSVPPALSYHTTDLGCAAALLSSGCELTGFDTANPGRVAFEFSGGPDPEGLADDYWGNRLTVKARQYFDNIRALKNRVRLGR